jgi:hypothetical protein
VPHADILAGAERYVARLNDPKFCKLLAGWLADERWTDEPVSDTGGDRDSAARNDAAKAARERIAALKAGVAA